MKITLESTASIVVVNGCKTRVWEGETESGVAIIAHIAVIAVRKDADNSQFEAELQERHTRAVQSWPLAMFLD